MERGPVGIESFRLGIVHLDQISAQSWSNYSMLIMLCLVRVCFLTRMETPFHFNLFWCLITLMIVEGGTKKPTNRPKKPAMTKDPQKLHIFHIRNFLYSTFIPLSLILILCISERNYALSLPGLIIQLKRAARPSLCILFVSSTNTVLSLISSCIPVPLQS